MKLRDAVVNLVEAAPAIRDATASGNLKVLSNLLGPAFRGLVLKRGKAEPNTVMHAEAPAAFSWDYLRDKPQLARLYEVAKRDQWNATEALDWEQDVDPADPNHPMLPEAFLPMADRPDYQGLSPKQKAEQNRSIMAWLLSQFLHGEQGALFAAAQVTKSVPWMDAKLYGSTQVVDEGRHIEVFHRYLTEKLEKRYDINDNLYVLIDALMGDGRWDMKFLSMQIMIEGLALGAFGTIREATNEPLLQNMLKYVIGDEARHVQYGVVALKEFYGQKDCLSEKERVERQDWVFEVTLLMRNRFLAHEFYEEFWAHAMTRREWDEMCRNSNLMKLFRKTMFKRIIPNIKRIGLLPDRLRPRYAELGLLDYEREKAAPELSLSELLGSVPAPVPA